MAKVIKNSLGNFLITCLIFSLVTGWFFSGWPQIWQEPPVPPDVQVARAAETVIVISTNDSQVGYECAPAAPNCFKLPGDWSDDNNIAIIGAGGGGGEAGSGGGAGPAGGGGAGAFASSTITGLTAGQEITFQVGTAGAGGTGNIPDPGDDGGDTYFNGSGATCSAQSVCAKGGRGGGGGSNASGGYGGNDADSIGATKYGGGGGAAGGATVDEGGGGGGTAGPTGAGATSTSSTGGDADGAGGAYGGGGVSGQPPGAGEDGINLSSSPQAGSGGGGGGSTKSNSLGGAGGSYGGGGGGGDSNVGDGGAGGGGVIVIKYTPGISYCITRTDTLGTIGYGGTTVNTSTSTNPGGVGELTTTFQNCGSQAKFEVNTGDSANWTAEIAAGTNQFVHNFTTSTADVYWKAMGIDISYAIASSTVDANESMNMWMQLDMPTDTTFYDQQSITVTVQASAP